jgi:hypothetical protein
MQSRQNQCMTDSHPSLSSAAPPIAFLHHSQPDRQNSRSAPDRSLPNSAKLISPLPYSKCNSQNFGYSSQNSIPDPHRSIHRTENLILDPHCSIHRTENLIFDPHHSIPKIRNPLHSMENPISDPHPSILKTENFIFDPHHSLASIKRLYLTLRHAKLHPDLHNFNPTHSRIYGS